MPNCSDSGAACSPEAEQAATFPPWAIGAIINVVRTAAMQHTQLHVQQLAAGTQEERASMRQGEQWC